MKDFITKECIVIGAGITGIALGRWLRVNSFALILFCENANLKNIC
jgi:hypothetical protein